jgi:hypothetical protein
MSSLEDAWRVGSGPRRSRQEEGKTALRATNATACGPEAKIEEITPWRAKNGDCRGCYEADQERGWVRIGWTAGQPRLGGNKEAIKSNGRRILARETYIPSGKAGGKC